ncbi:hypothetical protein Pelo_18419 [Pelomyxa schiedti]|nr:hypothetical protein Pelo_18419 [Pelomyxa schiedti]
MQRGHISVEVAIDARDQFVAMYLALCPPPSPPTIPSRAPARISNDVVRLIGERWVLTPVRRFIVKSENESCRPIVASIGATLGVVSAKETNEWTNDHTFWCWLGCDRILGRLWGKDTWACQQSSSQIVDWSKSPGGHRVGTIQTPKSKAISRAIPSPTSLWVRLEIPDSWKVDVVFSHTVPDLIGFGDEATVLARFERSGNELMREVMTVDLERSENEHVRKVMTVDLERSFSSGSLVVVKEERELTTRDTYCTPPCLFVDDASGHSVAVELVYERPPSKPFSAFVSNLATGERTLLTDGCRGINKAGNELVRVGTAAAFNVFTCQPCTSIIWPSDEYQRLMDRGLIVGKETTAGKSTRCICRAVIDAHTGLTLCRFHTLWSEGTTLEFL